MIMHTSEQGSCIYATHHRTYMPDVNGTSTVKPWQSQMQPLEAAYAHFERIEEDVPQAKR